MLVCVSFVVSIEEIIYNTKVLIRKTIISA